MGTLVMSSFTQQQLLDLGYQLQPDGSYARPSTIAQKRPFLPLSPKIPDSIPQHAPRATLVKIDERKAPSQSRVALRITRRGSKLLDCDNLAGGCKPLIDQLRYAGLIPNDDPASVEITFLQEKATKENQGTLIEILTSCETVF